MYLIDNYQLVKIASDNYLITNSVGAKISNDKFSNILCLLSTYEKHECSEIQLEALANDFQVDCSALKKVLIEKLKILKPAIQQKFPKIYINADDHVVSSLLTETLSSNFSTTVVTDVSPVYEQGSMVIFYRKNYSSLDFKNVYQNLSEDIYLVTAGVLHNLLIIDNLYFVASGLPTHFSNLYHLISFLKSDIPATKNNWLLFYRELIKDGSDTFPSAVINSCQKGYISYCLHAFVSQFTNVWKSPTPLDQINCFWQADLTSFTVHSEAAIHSPFSEYDMNLKLENIPEMEAV